MRLWTLWMKKKSPAPIRPNPIRPIPIRTDDAMARFDRLLAAMAPKVEAKRAVARQRKMRGPKPRRRTS